MRSYNEPYVRGEDVLPTPALLNEIPVPILNKVAEVFGNFTEDLVRSIAVTAAIALGCTLTQRRYLSENLNTTNLFFVIIAPTGAGKNFVKSGFNSILSKSGLTHLIGPGGFTSESGFRAAIQENPSITIVMDEMGDKLRAANQSASSQERRAFEAFKEVYSDSDGIYLRVGYSNANKTDAQIEQQNNSDVQCPGVTIVGLTTPMQILNALQDDHQEGGFINRFIMVDASNEPIIEKDMIRKEVPQWLIDWCREIRGTEKESYSESPDWKPVRFSDEVKGHFKALKREIRNRYLEDETAFNYSRRWRENSMRLATMLAVCKDSNKPIVTLELAEWATKYVIFYGERFISMHKEKSATTRHEQLCNLFLKALRDRGQQGITTTQMHREKPFKMLATKERNIILKELETGELAISSENTTPGAKRKTLTWFAKRI